MVACTLSAAAVAATVARRHPDVAGVVHAPRPPAAPAVAARRASAGMVLSSTAQVRVLVSYPMCGVRREGAGPVPVGLIGRTRSQVAADVAPEVVTGFSPTLLTLQRRFPGCPGDTVTLVERDGVVVELSGPPGDTGAVLRRTGIPVRGLGPGDAARIEAGLALPAGQAGRELAHLAHQAGAGAAVASATPSMPGGFRSEEGTASRVR